MRPGPSHEIDGRPAWVIDHSVEKRFQPEKEGRLKEIGADPRRVFTVAKDAMHQLPGSGKASSRRKRDQMIDAPRIVIGVALWVR